MVSNTHMQRGHKPLWIVVGTLLIFLIVGGASAAETTLLTDNFESYSIGTWPSSGGWEKFWNVNSDPSNNKVTNLYSSEGSNSLQIFGAHGGCWGAMTRKSVTLPKQFYVEASMMASGDAFTSGSCHSWAGDLWMSLGDGYGGTGESILLRFYEDSYFRATGESLLSYGQYNTMNWYNIKMKVDLDAGTVDYWINNDYAGQKFNQDLIDRITTNSYLSVGSGGGRGWIDNVKIYAGSPSITSISVSPSPATITVGSTQLFTATDQDGNPISVDWSSSDESVGTVSPATGTSSTTFTALKAGAATVTATSGSVVGSTSVISTSGPMPELDISDIIVLGSKNVGDVHVQSDEPKIFRMDKNGNRLWEKLLPFQHLLVYPNTADRNVAEDSFYMNTGWSGYGKVSENLIDGKVRIFKFDADGNLIWDIPFSPDIYEISANPVDGGAYIADNKLGVSKIDTNGNIIWGPKAFALPPYYAIETDFITGGVFVGGGNTVMKLDRDGNTLWEISSFIDVTKINFNPIDGGIYVGTKNYASETYKLDVNGNIEWVKSNFPSYWTYGRAVSPIDGALYIFSGWPDYLAKTAMDGTVLWNVFENSEWTGGALAAEIEENNIYRVEAGQNIGINKLSGNDASLIWHKDPLYYVYNGGYGPQYYVFTGMPSKANPDTIPPTTTDNSPSTWQNSDFTVTLTCNDNIGGSGCKETKYRIDAGIWQTGASILISEDGNHTIEYYSVDNADNEENHKTIYAKLDKTAPTIDGAPTTSPNANGWYNGDVTVRFTCQDGISGPVDSFFDMFFPLEGENLAVDGNCKDNAGNEAAKTVSGINIDKTAPTITGSRTPAANANGWNSGDVTVHFDCADGLSEVESCTSDTVVSSEGAGQSVTGTVTDKAGNTASVSVAGINIDKTAPTITGSRTPAANANGWNSGDVTVHFDCADGLSTVESCTSDTVVSMEGAEQSVVGTVTDKAGNTASTSVDNIKIDKTQPLVTITVPAGEYLLSQNVLADWSAVDPISGLASATGTKLSGEAIDTSSVGTKTFEVTALDNAGNSVTKTVSYRVSYNFAGFYRPIDNLPSWNSVKAGSAVPVKFNLGGDQGLDIFEANYPASAKIDCASQDPIEPAEKTATSGSSGLSYDVTIDQYNYVWKTDKEWAGSCRELQVQLKDGTYHNAVFKFSK